MKFRYREPHEMKDSGVEWLGMIPKEWEIRKLKTFFTFEKGKNAALYTNEYIGSNEGEYPVYSGQTENNGIMGKINSYDYDTEECIFTTTVGAKVMTPMLLKNKFSLSQNCLIMIGNHKINNRYTYNVLFPMFRYEKSIIPTHMQPSLRIDDLNKFKIPYPKLNEQEKIATFLDQKTAEFDNIIAKKQAFIDKLTEAKKSLISEVVTGKKKVTVDNGKLIVENRKAEDMKDSGVEWLGMIPKEWGVKRIKDIAQLNKSSLSNNENDNLEINYIDIGSVNSNGEIKEIQSFTFSTAPSRARRITNKNDIIVSTVRTYLKAISYIENDYSNLICSTGFAVFTPNSTNVIPKFFYFMIKSELYINEIVKRSTGVSYPAINASQIADFNCSFPSIENQNVIIEFLDEKTAKIDNTIEKIKVQIEKLKEAKQSLISEAVTGKIEVM